MSKINNSELHQKVKELTLLLLYLNSWEESELGVKCRRSWKGFDFDILNELADEGLIGGSYRSKSVSIGDEGIKKVEKLLKKYNFNEFT